LSQKPQTNTNEDGVGLWGKSSFLGNSFRKSRKSHLQNLEHFVYYLFVCLFTWCQGGIVGLTRVLYHRATFPVLQSALKARTEEREHLLGWKRGAAHIA
jgi:hypothetical protein